MTFYDLVHSLTDADVYEALYDQATEIELKENNPWAGLDEDSCYRNKQEYIEYHFYAWQQLKELGPIPSDLILCVNWIDETKDEKLIAELAEYGGEPEQGYEVLGYSTTGEGFYDCNTFGDYFSENPTAPYYAIEFRPWEEWLGMKLSIATMCLPRKRVIAECLWEMTFISNEQTEIQMRFGCLLGTVEEVKDAIDKGDVEYV